MPADPIEARLLHAVADALAQVRASAAYHYDINAAYVVSRPQVKYLGEQRAIALVHPGGLMFEPDTSCQTRVIGDFYVTVARRFDEDVLPWEGGYEPLSDVQLRLVWDVKKALHGRQFLPENVYVFLTDRDVLGAEADGWAVAQAQLSFEMNVAD